MDWKTERESCDLKLRQVAEESGWSVAAVNGLERTGKGSERLKEKLREIYSSKNARFTPTEKTPPEVEQDRNAAPQETAYRIGAHGGEGMHDRNADPRQEVRDYIERFMAGCNDRQITWLLIELEHRFPMDHFTKLKS